MTKSNANISVDSDILANIRKAGIPISATCEAALGAALNYSPTGDFNIEDIDKKMNKIKAELSSLERAKLNMAETVIEEKNKDNALESFMKDTSPNIVGNGVALKYWSEKTGKTIEELIDLKRSGL